MSYSDLHLHLDGSLPLETVKVLSWLDRDSELDLPNDEDELRKLLTYDYDIETVNQPHGIYERQTSWGRVILKPEEYMQEGEVVEQKKTRSLDDYLKKFDIPLKLLQTEENISYAVQELAKDLKGRGVDYAEIRFAPQLHTRRGLSQIQVVEAVLNGYTGRLDFTGDTGNSDTMKKLMEYENALEIDMGLGKKPDFPHIRFILCLMRGNMKDTKLSDANMETVEAARYFMSEGNSLIAGLDLAGAEGIYPTKDYGDFFGIARRHRIPFTIHAGEAAGPDSIYEALEMGASRIGHGIAAAKDEGLMRELARRGTIIEMCPTSNIQTGAADSIFDYPLRTFMSHGMKVTINSDNMTVSDTDITREFAFLEDKLSLTAEEKAVLMKNADEGHL